MCKAELDYGLDSWSLLLTNYSHLDEAKDLFMFPEKVSNVNSVSVCYYGTNTTSLENVERLQAYFIVYGPSSVSLTQLPQSIMHRKSKICKSIDLGNSYNAALQFGVFIPKVCFVNRNETNICPLKLNFFSKSCRMLLGTTLGGISDLRNQSAFRNQILQRVTSMEEVCVNLNIRIDIAGNKIMTDICAVSLREEKYIDRLVFMIDVIVVQYVFVLDLICTITYFFLRSFPCIIYMYSNYTPIFCSFL